MTIRRIDQRNLLTNLGPASPIAKPTVQAAADPKAAEKLLGTAPSKVTPPPALPLDKRLADVEATMRAAWDNGQPVIKVSAPGRVNLIGEHLDYNEGFVFPAAIDRCFAGAFQARDDGMVTIRSMNQDTVVSFDLAKLQEPTGSQWGEYVRGVAQALAERGVKLKGLHGVIESDIPMGGGLSSSAALELLIAKAMAKAAGVELSNLELAKIGQRAESEYVGVKCGIMDQFASAMGKKGAALLIDTRTLEHQAVRVDLKGYQVVIGNTNKKRSLLETPFNQRLEECQQALAALREVSGEDFKTLRDVSPERFAELADQIPSPLRERAAHVISENERVLQAVEVLKGGGKDALAAFGQLMNASHASLRDHFGASCKELDAMVELAQAQPGVLGARMTGAGWGGCTVSLVKADQVDAFIEKVAAGYEAATGLVPEMYAVSLEEGLKDHPAPERGKVAARSIGGATHDKRRGFFVKANDQAHQALGEKYLQSKESGLAKAPEGAVSRVEADSLDVDLDQLSPAELAELAEVGRQKMQELYYLTSGAGLWSRGGGQVKALVPLNLASLLDAEEQSRLNRAADIVNAPSLEQALALAGVKLADGEDAKARWQAVVAEAKQEIDQLITKARADQNGLNALQMKLVNVALQSAISGTYVPFDVWTSEQTHRAIYDHLEWMASHHDSMRFHPDPRVERVIQRALADYFAESAARGDHHVFGYQVGYHALDPEDAHPLQHTPLIGEGAGMAKAYLDEAGKTAALAQAGKTAMVFENIEVVTDLPVALGAYAKTDRDVGVVLVPQKDGYKGGSPFWVEKDDGTKSLELHEMSVLPKDLVEDNAFFNANTIFQSLSLPPPSDLGFEVKNQGTEVRAKLNAGDVTKQAPTAGIGGRIGTEYENFKSYQEYIDNGEKLLGVFHRIWSRDAELLARSQRSAAA